MKSQFKTLKFLLICKFLMLVCCFSSIAQHKQDLLPQPSGKYSIGTSTFELTDNSRSDLYRKNEVRKIPIQIWYPGKSVSGLSASYLPETKLLNEMIAAKYNHQDSTALTHMAKKCTHAEINAPILKRQKYPLILFSHGQGVSKSNYTVLAEEFASQGYIVLAMDHPYGGFALLADGTLLTTQMDKLLYGAQADEILQKRMQEWAQDVTFVLDQILNSKTKLGKKFCRSIDKKRIAAAGHSLGGNVAMRLPALDNRIKASINLDGGSFLNMNGKAPVAPTLVIRSQPVYTAQDLEKKGRNLKDWEAMGKEIDSVFNQALSGSKEAYELKIAGTGHMSFSDAPFVLPDMINRFGGKIIAPERGQEIIVKAIDTFLNMVFYKRQSKLADEMATYPEVKMRVYHEDKKNTFTIQTP